MNRRWCLAELLRTPSRRSSQNTEILRKLDSSKSQPLATIPRLVCGDVRWHARDRSHDQGEDLHLDEPGSGDCYSELPRINLPRTPVNKGRDRPSARCTAFDHGRMMPSLRISMEGGSSCRQKRTRSSCVASSMRSTRVTWWQ